MKNALRNLLGAGLLAATLSTPAHAQTGYTWPDWYASLSGDVTWLHDDTGGGGNVAIGTRLPFANWSAFRLEGEVGYHDVPGNFDSHYWTYMGNLYYDFPGIAPGSSDRLVPYIGAGLGDATLRVGRDDFSGSFSDHGNVFAYQFMAGLTYTPSYTPNIDWSLGYRWQGSDSVSGYDNAGYISNEQLHASNIELGVRFHF